jgi:hypothetical protein
MILVENILTTGTVGSVALGQPPRDVQRVLGEPCRVSRKRSPLLHKYGSIELAYWRSPPDPDFRLVQIAVDYGSSSFVLPQPFDVRSFLALKSASRESLIEHLRRLGCEPRVTSVDDEVQRIRLRSGVELQLSCGSVSRLEISERQLV